jgi:hypothetical protein
LIHTHTRSVRAKVFDVWRSPGRFTKNPDLVQLPSGRLLFVYSDTDAHWAQKSEVITLVASDDGGKSWFKFKEVARAEQPRDERLVTPRLSRLNDGRLIVICDHDDFTYFHESQGSGNWAWWSEDDGVTWSEHQVTGILGFEPDRMMDLPDGSLGVASHILLGESQEFADILSVSENGGKTWKRRSIIAHDGYHRFCEGALVILHGGKRLACVLRENHSAGIPSFVTFSDDCGQTWTEAQRCPFALHRPYAKQLADGRVLVTGRHVNGGLGCYGWVGDLEKEAGDYAVGGPRRKFYADLANGALTIRNAPEHECRYTLLPPESSRSEVDFEARLSVEGPPDEPVAFLSVSSLQPLGGNGVLRIASNWIAFSSDRPDKKVAIDLTQERTISIQHRGGLLDIRVDGETLVYGCVFQGGLPLPDFHGGNPERRTQFGQFGETGASRWKSVFYSVKNPNHPDFNWAWKAASGRWPDQYQRDRMIQIHANHPDQKPNPDHGYSSWVVLDDGRIMFVDYTNCGDPAGQSHIVGVFLDPSDLS